MLKKTLKEAKKHYIKNVFQLNGLKLGQKNARATIYCKTKEHDSQKNNNIFFDKNKEIIDIKL